MSDPHLIAAPADAREFMFGGKARFTLRSLRTGTRYTYRVSKAKDKDSMFFASVLTGPDNGSDYSYIGFFGLPAVGLIPGKKGNPNHPAYKALDWTAKMLAADRMPPELEFWHEGRCARCGRALTDPASIARGLGPECASKGL